MADADCTRCPELDARLSAVAGELWAFGGFINAELAEPTMPWKELIPLIVVRVENAANTACGGY